jgi:hypothetical protein
MTVMFIAEADKKELRQGDIIAAVWYPRIKFQDIRVVAPIDHSDRDKIIVTPELVGDKSGMEWVATQIEMTRRFVMILSQCCDLVMDKGRTRGIAAVVSPLVPVPERYRRKAEYEVLRANKVEEYVNIFYVEQHAPLPSEFIVDFARVASIGLAGQYQHLLDHKVLQLTDDNRIVLKSKIAFNFGRLTPEEQKAGFKLAMPASAPSADEEGEPPKGAT